MYNEETKATVGAQFNCANAMRSITVSTSRSIAALPQGFGKAGLLLATCLLYLAPAPAALAQNECGLQVGTTPVECGDASYGSGVTYDAVGDLFIEFTNPTRSTIGGNGVALTGDGVEGIDFDSATTATELQSAGTTGPLLGVTTVNGDIVIATEEMDADESAAGVTHAIFAESTGTGSIDITTTGNVDAQSGTNPDTSIGIEAITNSGDITVTAGDNVAGNQYGILAEAGGAGDLTITASGSVRTANATGGGTAAIGATTGTGQLTIAVSGSGSVRGGSGVDAGILANAGGDALIDVASGGTLFGLNLTVAGEATINNDGSISGINAAGNTLTLNNNSGGEISRFLDFSDLTGGYTFNNNAGATWLVNVSSSTLGAGDLNNAGTIEFLRGTFVSAEGTTFTATGDSVLEIAAVLDGAGQPSCTSPTIAACLDLSGGSTSGQTNIRFLATTNPDPLDVPLAPPINPGIVVVDVGGGTTQADHFVLDPGSTGYATDSKYGSVLATGDLFDYTLLYNSDNQQHVLTSVPRREGMEYVSFIHQTLSIWHTTTDTVVGRQADLREGGARGGWARIVRDNTERDAEPTLVTHGNTFVYDNSYSLDTKAFVAGYDMTEADNYVIGLHGGLMSADLKYDNSSSGQETKGAIAGLYAGWWNEAGLTLDGAVNVNFASIKRSMRDFENSETNAMSYGARAEAGWRFSMSENFYVQPLATAAYVVGNIEEQDLRFYDATFENDESARAALGVRLGGDIGLTNDNFNRLKYWLTARAWEEYAGDDAQVHFKTEADPLVIEDDLSGNFEELGMGVSLTSPSEAFSLFLSGNAQLGDDADSYNLTIGTRLYW